MNILFLTLLAALITFISIHFFSLVSKKINLIDIPTDRKPHIGSIPVIGGLAMFLGISIATLLSPYDLNQFSYFLVLSLIIVTIGMIDDYQNISALLRLFLQIIIAIIMATLAGINLDSVGNLLGNSDLILGKWAFTITVIAIISSMNAVNMTDGIHGLAGGNSLITFLSILYLSIGNPFQPSLIIVLLFCSVLPVFLIYNLCIGISQKKRIFMGDAGSLFIGLSIAWVLIEFSQGSYRIFSPVTALFLFALPLYEMSTAILRRLLSGSPLFKPDLFHSHHLLIRFGIKEKYTLILILFISLIMAVTGILGEEYNVPEKKMLIGFIIIFLIYFYITSIVLKKLKASNK